MTVIAMTREMGTRGKQVATLLSERLAARLVYHELIEDPPDPADSTGPSEVRRNLNGDDAVARSNGAAERNGRMTPLEILESASRGNVLLRGWGAVRLLHGIPHVLCVRVCAPMEARIAEMMRRLGVSERTARREIERNDAAHTGVLQRFFGTDWRDPLDYDMVLNSANLTPGDCADLIVETAARPVFSDNPESRQALAERLVEARIAALLAGSPRTRRAAPSVYVSASGGTVRLFGNVGARDVHEIADLVRSEIGEFQVINDLHTSVGYPNA